MGLRWGDCPVGGTQPGGTQDRRLLVSVDVLAVGLRRGDCPVGGTQPGGTQCRRLLVSVDVLAAWG